MDLNTDLPGPPDTAGQTRKQFARPGGAIESTASASAGDLQMDTRLLAQDEERRRLGRELHDSTGQLLLALRLGIARLKQVHVTNAEDETLAEIEETASRIDREIRSFAFENYPATVGRDGLATALQSLARGFGARTGLRIKFKDRCDDRIDDGPAAVALLRVAQEGLTNVHRHARAAHVAVDLTTHEDMIELRIRDDGQGIGLEFENGSVSGVGLQGMKHRTERLGGRFSIRRLKHGTRLFASVPLPA